MKKNLAALSLALCLAAPGTAAASFYPMDQGGLFSTQSLDPANPGDLRRLAIAQVTMKAFQEIFGGFGSSGNSGTTTQTENGEPVVIQRSGGVLQTPNQSSADVWMTIPPGGDRTNGLVAISMVADPAHPIESSSGQARAVRAKINVNAIASGARLQMTVGGKQVQPGEFFMIDADPKSGVYTSQPQGLVQIRILAPNGQQAGFLVFNINYRVQKFTSFAANPDGQNSDTYQEIKPGTVALLRANESAYIGNAGSKFGEYDAQLDGVTITAINGREATVRDPNGDEMAVKLPSRGEFKAGDKIFVSGKMRQEGDKKFLEAQTVSAEKLNKSGTQNGAAAFGKPGEKNFGDGADFLAKALDSANAEQDRVKRLQDSAKSSLMAPAGAALPSAFGGGGGGGMSVQRTVDPNNPAAGAQTIFSRLLERVFGTNAATTASIFEFNPEKGKDGATQILGILAVAALALVGGPAAAAIALGSGFVLTIGFAAAMALAGDTSSLAGLGQFFIHPLKSAQALFSESPGTVAATVATAVIMQKIGRFLPASFAESLGNYAAKMSQGGSIARAMSGAIEGIANKFADMSVAFAQKLGAEGSLRQVMNGGAWGERLGAVAHARALAKEFQKEFGLRPDSGFVQKLEAVTDKMGYDIAEAGERVCAALNRGKTPSFQDVRQINMELKRGSEGTVKTIEDTAQQLIKEYNPDTPVLKLAHIAANEGEEMGLLGNQYLDAVERQTLYGEFERISTSVERGYFERSSKTWSQRPLDVQPTAAAAGQGTATGQINR